ncbi:MAG: hypothetical protein KKC37_01205 [Proteobacteria bacterium]|nr:hypothetical protein [Pseudomonadota bacterium]
MARDDQTFRWPILGLICLILALGVRLGAAWGPFTPPLDDPAAGQAVSARYHVQSGLKTTLGLPVRFVTTTKDGRSLTGFDLKRPAGGPLYVGLWFSVFGAGPVGARTAGLAFTLLGLVCLLHLAWRLYSPLTAVTTILLLALAPAGVILSPRAGAAQAAMGLALVTIWAYLSWIDTRQERYKWAMWLSFAPAVGLDWSVQLLAVIIPAHHYWSVSRALRNWPTVLALPALAGVHLGLYLLVTQLVFGTLNAPGALLFALKAQWAVNPLDWLAALGGAVLYWLTLPLTALGVVWIFTRLRPAKFPDLVRPPRIRETILDPRIPIRTRTAPLWMLLALGLVPVVAAPAWAARTPHAWWPLIFFLALAGARALDDLAVRLYDLDRRVVMRSTLAGLVVVWSLVQLIVIWPTRGTQARDLGRFIAAQTPPRTSVLATLADAGPAVVFYAGRQVVWGVDGPDKLAGIQKGARVKITRLIAQRQQVLTQDWLKKLAAEHPQVSVELWSAFVLDRKLPRKVKKAPPRPRTVTKPAPIKTVAPRKPGAPAAPPKPAKPTPPAAPKKTPPQPAKDVSI